jgi:hypothetical protein
MLAAQRARIAAVTAAALLVLFVGQPLHGPAVAAEFGSAVTSFAADASGATSDAHHAHLCPLCRAANQARFAMAAAGQANVTAFVFHGSLAPATPDRLTHRLHRSPSAARAPPSPLSPLV